MSRRAAWVTAVWLLGMGGFFAYARSVGETPRQLFLQLVDWMQVNPWSPLLFLLAFCARPVTLLPAALFSMAAGFCYGLYWGMFWAHLAGALAAALFYGLGRWLGLKRGLAGWWDRAIDTLREGGVVSLIVLRFCFLPYDPVSYLGGALRLPFLSFLIANFIGNLPGTSSCVLLGASMQGGFGAGNVPVNWRLLVASWVMLLLMLGLGRWLRRRSRASQTGGSSGFLCEDSAPTQS